TDHDRAFGQAREGGGAPAPGRADRVYSASRECAARRGLVNSRGDRALRAVLGAAAAGVGPCAAGRRLDAAGGALRARRAPREPAAGRRGRRGAARTLWQYRGSVVVAV